MSDLGKKIKKVVDTAFKKVYNDARPGDVGRVSLSSPKDKFGTIDEYRELTGKRFRMTKEQKERNLTREQAFLEFKENLK